MFELLLYAAAFLIFVYRLTKLEGRKEAATLLAVFAFSFLLFAFEKTSIPLLMSGVILFNAIITSYGTRRCYLFIAIALAYASIAYPIGANFMLQSLFLGMLSGSNISKENKKSMLKGNELRRNMVQLIAGVAFILVFYLLQPDFADAVLFIFVIMGSLLGNYAMSRKKSQLSSLLYGFERNGAILGSGARWLAIGCLVAASFLTQNLVIAVFSAIFIGDSFSTLVGVSFKTPRLSYNDRKTVGGSVAYFISVAAISYFFIGPPAILVGAFAALFESQPYHIDDNFDVALAMVLFFLVLAYFGFPL